MKIRNWILYVLNLFGIILFLMIPIFNLWYLGQLMGESMFKQCKKHWEDGS